MKGGAYSFLLALVMAKINFIAIGGVQENGKNLYILEIDERIFVLDCGLKYPTSDLYGVDVIVNDISYLVENKDRIVSVLLFSYLTVLSF